MSEIIKLEHATVRRNGVEILKDASLTVKRGESLAIIGPNGAGKSTLVNVLSKEIHPLAKDDFRLQLFGQDRWMVMELRKHMGIVSQSLAWYCNTTYTVEEIVVSGLYSAIGLDFHHVVTEEDRFKAEKEMKNTGVWHLKDKFMNTLSSGERERTLIARAAITDPSLLLLDEASTALDFPSRAKLRDIISAYAQRGKTIIMVTHELSEIIKEIDRVIVMKEGTMVADGTKEEVLNEALLSEVYGHKIFIDRRDGLFNAWC